MNELCVPLRSLARILGELESADVQGLTDRLRRDLLEATNVWTPLGKLLFTAHIPLQDGSSYACICLNPAALLYHLCAKVAAFGHFFRALAENRADLDSLVLYTDECTTGNQLSPDPTTKLQCVYWTLSFFPAWFRSRDCGWFHFAFLPYVVQQKVLGGFTAFCKHILFSFFEGPFNFALGIRLLIANSGHTLFFQARLLCFIQDEAALKYMNSVKGASGTKCCMKCKNVTRLWNVEGDAYLRDFATASPDDFDLHTDASFLEMIDKLPGAFNDLGNKEFKIYQQLVGITYNAHGLLWEMRLRQHYKPIQHTYEDWMHGLCASGGVGQYTLNGFVHAVKEAGIPTEDLDAFQSKIKWPSHSRHLSKDFFCKRPSDDPKGHIKAFAGETLQAVQCMALLTCVFPSL